jgi:hypothetical protein
MALGAAERCSPAQMPLHAITPVYGEADLRERPAIEISAFPPGDRVLIQAALGLAAQPLGLAETIIVRLSFTPAEGGANCS